METSASARPVRCILLKLRSCPGRKNKNGGRVPGRLVRRLGAEVNGRKMFRVQTAADANLITITVYLEVDLVPCPKFGRNESSSVRITLYTPYGEHRVC